MDDNFFTDKELRKVNGGNVMPKVVIVLVVIAILGLVFILGKNYLSSRNSVKIFMEDYFTRIENSLDRNVTSESINLNLSVLGSETGDNKEIFKVLNNLEFDVTASADYEQKIVNTDVNVNYINDNLLKVSGYFENKKVYIYLDNIYDKYIEVNTSDIVNEPTNNGINVSREDIKIIMSSLKNEIINSLGEDYFTKSKVKVDGESLNKVALLLDDKNIKLISRDVINNLKSNNSFIDSLSRILNKSKEDTIELLEDKLDSINNNTFTSITISVYTKFTKFVKIEVREDNNIITINKDDNVYSYNITGEYNYSGTIEINKNSNKLNIIIKDDSDIVVKLNVVTDKNIKVDKKNITNSILYNDITSDDYQVMYKNILNNKVFKKIYDDVTSSNNKLGVV